MITPGLKNRANNDGRVTEPWLCTLCKSITKGAVRLCLCDLKPVTQLVHSDHLKRPAAGCCLIGSSAIFSSGFSGATFLPWSKTSCINIHEWVIVRETGSSSSMSPLQTRSSDSMARTCRAGPHSGTLHEIYCQRHVFGVREEVLACDGMMS